MFSSEPSQPMMVGSPTSPTSPTSPLPQERSSFLPAYLMGEPAQSPTMSSSRLWSSGTGQSGGSPPKAMGRSMVLSPSAGANQSHHSPRPDSRQRDLIGGRRKDKLGAPPVTGLMDTGHSSAVFTPETRSEYGTPAGRIPMGTSSFTGTPTQGIPADSSFLSPPGSNISQMYATARKTPPSPAQVDPFYTQGESIRPEDDLDDTWVTIFGFPPAATSFILQQFSQYGNIIKHVVATEGNWLHLHYQSKLQAKKALSKNGKVFGSSIMVGVAPCIDKSVMEKNLNQDSIHKTRTFGNQLQQSVLEQESSIDTSKHTPIRPLTAAYKAVSNDHQVVPNSNTPKKNTGVISKAVEYMFGW